MIIDLIGSRIIDYDKNCVNILPCVPLLQTQMWTQTRCLSWEKINLVRCCTHSWGRPVKSGAELHHSHSYTLHNFHTLIMELKASQESGPTDAWMLDITEFTNFSNVLFFLADWYIFSVKWIFLSGMVSIHSTMNELWKKICY